MNDKTLSRIEAIYHEALDIPSEQRSSFLARSCAGDAELYAEVESLLGFADFKSSIIDTPPMDVAAEIFSDSARPDIVGKEIGAYRIISKIGSGGMGDVFLAEDTKLERRVAIKCIKTEIAQIPDQLRRFLREAKTASALNHPNILTVYEIGEIADMQFIAAEYIDGKTLRKAIADKSLTFFEKLEVISQVAMAVSAAHAAGIVHRDIKPENIMLRRDKLVKVLDFGLAKFDAERPIGLTPPSGRVETGKSTEVSAAPPLSQSLTAPGLMMGTVAYMSPEQARMDPIDQRSDIWSIGVVLYEMIAGRKPFPGSTAKERLASILEDPLLPFEDEIPAEFGRIVFKALEKNAERRYQNADQFLADIYSFQNNFIGETGHLNEVTASGDVHISSRSGSRMSFPNRWSGEARVSSPQSVSTDPGALDQRAGGSLGGESVSGSVKGRQILFAGVITAFILAIIAGGYFYSLKDPGIDRSLAVLPFVNETGDPEIDYLADGMSESLIDSISQLPNLRVIAKNSSFQFEGKDVDLDDVVRKLNVNFVLRGRIVRNGNEFQIVPELINASDKTKVWGKSYSRKLPNLINVEPEISRAIADKMRLDLTNNEQKQLVKVKNVDPKAYELLLKGRFYKSNGGTENSEKAIEFFNRALDVDPKYAEAYASIADTYFYLGVNSFLDPKEALPKA
ncbi:MAG: protein kinase, partial [Acidobacteria bacterium]|nr:protein kinase [Acidobacteriota bacterium]